MCDTFVSLTDGGVILGKNSDRDPNEAQVVRWHAAADHPEGTEGATTWSRVPQARHTYAVMLSQPWWLWGAEMGTNEHGVTIGNEAVFTWRTASVGGELLGMDLLRLALERAATRHEAVEVIVGLLERYGQGGSCSRDHPEFTYDNSYLIADPDGAVVLETAGRRHAVEEVTGRGRSISNGLTIPGFAEAYGDPLRGRVAQCAARRARTTAGAGRTQAVADAVTVLRDHGAGAAPAYSLVNGALGAPCAHAGGLVTSTQSTASWVADLGSATHWVTGTSAPCLSLFRPVRVAQPLDEGPPVTDRTNGAADEHPWWRHERLHRAVLRDWSQAEPLFRDRDDVERAWFEAPPDPADAARVSAEWTERWIDRLGHSADRRPRWLRSLWETWDRRAQIVPDVTLT